MRPNHNRNPRGGGKRPFQDRRRGGGGRNDRGGGGGGGRQYQNPRPINSLKEKDVFISEFIGSTAPFDGIIKSKFSDFQVNEISLDGDVVALTDISVPSAPLDEDVEQLLQTTDPELEGLVTEDQWTRITKMIEEKAKGENIKIDVTDMSKESRTKIHVVVKSRFGQQVVSSTIDEDGRKFIRCSLFNKTGK